MIKEGGMVQLTDYCAQVVGLGVVVVLHCWRSVLNRGQEFDWVVCKRIVVAVMKKGLQEGEGYEA